MGTRHWVFVVLVVLSCAACGGPEGAPDGGLDASVGDTNGLDSGGDAGRIEDVHAFCDAYYERVCAWHATCRSPGSTMCSFPLAADLLLACEDIDANLAAGIVAYDPAAAAECLLVDISSCVRIFDTPACVAAIRGNVPVGGDCYELVAGRSFNQECVPEAFCSLDTCPGTCVARGGAGADCTVVPCGGSLLCREAVCIERPTEGEACDSVCAAPSVCLEGTCFVQRGEGESCAGDPAGSCIYPFACASGTCAATSGPDEPCRVDAACPDDHVCQSLSDGQRCRALLDDGEPCDETAPLCRHPESYCHDLGTEGAPDFRCAAYLADGEDCSIYQCTAPSWCRGGGPGDAPGGTCRPSGDEGAICASTVHRSGGGSRCQSGLHCGEGGLCHGPRPAGGGCSDSGQCMDGLWCQANTCAPASALGGSCRDGDGRSCVASAYCDESNTCVPRLPDGASCTSSEQCVNEGCDGTTCLPRLVRCFRP